MLTVSENSCRLTWMLPHYNLYCGCHTFATKKKLGKLRYLSKNISSGCLSRMLRNGQTVRKTPYIYITYIIQKWVEKNPLNCKMNSLFSPQMDLTHGATACSALRSDVPVLLIELFWKPSESPDAAGETSADLAADLGSVCCGPAMMILRPFFRWGAHNGEVFFTLKDESMWHEEENFQPISPPDYPTTYSSLIACFVS